MPWTTLIFSGLAIASWRFAQTHSDHVAWFLGVLATTACLIASLATAPILIKSIILIALVVTPLCPSTSKFGDASTCPRLCLVRQQCQSTPD